MERSDRLLKELHEKEDVIAELKENSRKERDRIGVLYKKVGTLQEEVERLKELLRSTKKHLSIYERKAASAEKRGKVQTKKALSLVKEPQSTLTSRILVLESIIRELGSQLNLPVNEIIALSEICTENDPLLKNVLQNNEENDNNEDLIDYLDKNGVNSILGIEIDRSGID